jgi:hypothetical protein
MSHPWYVLVNSEGQPYEGTSEDQVKVSVENVLSLRRAIAEDRELARILAGIVSSQLRVYRNKQAFFDKEVPLNPDAIITGLGSSANDALVILVPPSCTSLPASQGLVHSCLLGWFSLVEITKLIMPNLPMPNLSAHFSNSICGVFWWHC